MQIQTAVTTYLKSKQVLLFDFELQDSLLPSSTDILTAVQRQTAVAAYLSSKQLLLFVFEVQDSLMPSSSGILIAVQRQTAVTAYLKSNTKAKMSQRLMFFHEEFLLITKNFYFLAVIIYRAV